MKLAALVALALTASAGGAVAGDEAFAGVRVVFARGNELFATDARGKGPAQKVATLPTGELRAMRVDPAGTVAVVDVGGQWSWLPLDGSRTSPTPLPCAAGDLALAADGKCVACATASGQLQLVRLDSGKAATRSIAATGVALVGSGASLEIVWADADGVWSASAARATDLTRKRRLAPAAPRRGFSVSPDGKRAVGVYEGVLRKGKVETTVEHLYTFALDGRGARRKSIRDGAVRAWSTDGTWALVQDAARGACVMRVAGGEYKCWKGFEAVSLSGDGSTALLLGPRGGAGGDDDDDGDDGRDPGGDGEGGEDDGGDDDAPVTATTHGPRSLFRATVPGTYTEKPALVETVIDGSAAAWIDAP